MSILVNLFNKFKNSVVRRRLKKSKIPFLIWRQATLKMPMVQRYSVSDRAKLRLLAGEVLRVKRVHPVQGMVLTDEIRTMIATQAAMLVFGLESTRNFFVLSWLRNWQSIIVYPAPFWNGRENVLNISGAWASRAAAQSGETSYQGGIVIDWFDNEPHPLTTHANQVLIHEMAHKLDMLDGYTNGHPPLHRRMRNREWLKVFVAAYQQLHRQIDAGQAPDINPYAATNPAEFFAVASEYFFESPSYLKQVYPEVYRKLCLFYKQDLASY